MNKKVFIVSSTFRKNGNSEILAEEFAHGATVSGNKVTKLNLRDIKLNFCIGCMYCQTHNKCVLNDNVNNYLAEIQESDILVFATPIYYYEMSGQLKTFLDRLNPLYPRQNKFKKVYLLASSAENSASAMDKAILGIQGWIDCFENVTLEGVVRGTGANEPGEINKTMAPKVAYELGKSIL